MRQNKEKAIELRRKGLSYKQIREELNIPLSTLASWFKDADWSKVIKNHLSKEVSWSNPKTLELLAKANHERWKLKHEEYRNAAAREFVKHKENPLFLAGVMLYWAEGDKLPKSSVVRFRSSDPEMIRVFNLFLAKIPNIPPEKISARLLLYPDLIDSVQKNFWGKATGLKTEQFKRSIFIKGRHASKRSSFGVCTIVVHSRALKERILKWLDMHQDYLKSAVFNVEK